MKPVRVFVLGHRGMLGHTVRRYLSGLGMQVLVTDERYTGEPNDKLVAVVRSSPADWIINTIGKLDAAATPFNEMLLVNSRLPVHLKSFLRENQRMMHASSDGVFSGAAGNYRVDSERDAVDPYGFSKILGEVVGEEGRSYVIRTSIVGLSANGKSGLLSWFLNQQTGVKGFTNHLWNGITTLEWAKLCAEIISGKLRPEEPVLQPACSETVSKYELLQLIGRTWSHPAHIQPVTHATPVNRTLLPTHKRAPIVQQLQELRDWYQPPPSEESDNKFLAG